MITALERRKGDFVADLESFHAYGAFLLRVFLVITSFVVVTNTRTFLAVIGQTFISLHSDAYLPQNLLSREGARPAYVCSVLDTAALDLKVTRQYSDYCNASMEIIIVQSFDFTVRH